MCQPRESVALPGRPAAAARHFAGARGRAGGSGRAQAALRRRSSIGVPSPGASRVQPAHRWSSRSAASPRRAASGLPDEPRGGWWHEVVGPGLALDTQRFRILSFDYLGASADSTGPRDGAAVSHRRQPTTRPKCCCGSSIISASRRLRAIAGASYGGMVALAFGERYPGSRRAAHRHQRRGSRASDGQRLARGAATHRAVRARVRQGGAGPGAGARAGHGDVSQPGGIRGALSQRAPRARTAATTSCCRSRSICSRAAPSTRSAIGPSRFVCLSESIDLHRVDAARIFAPVDRDRRARGPARAARRHARHGRAPAECRAARDLLGVRPRCLPQGEPASSRRSSSNVLEIRIRHDDERSTPAHPRRARRPRKLRRDRRRGAAAAPVSRPTPSAASATSASTTTAARAIPTRDLLAEALADLEGGAGAVITGSGMGAITLARPSAASGRARRRAARLLRRHLPAVHRAGSKRSELARGIRRLRRMPPRCAALSKPRRAWCGSKRRAIRCCASPTSRDIARRAHAHGRAGGGRQHLPVTGLAAPDRARRGHRGAFDHQVHQRPQRRGRRRGHRARRKELPSSSSGGATAWASPARRSTASSRCAACAPCRCGCAVHGSNAREIVECLLSAARR